MPQERSEFAPYPLHGWTRPKRFQGISAPLLGLRVSVSVGVAYQYRNARMPNLAEPCSKRFGTQKRNKYGRLAWTAEPVQPFLALLWEKKKNSKNTGKNTEKKTSRE